MKTGDISKSFGKGNLDFELILFEVHNGLSILLDHIDTVEKRIIFQEFTKNLRGAFENITYEESLQYIEAQPNMFKTHNFEVVNMMVKCKLQCIEKDNFFFDLNTLKNKNDEMYYSSESVPSMMMPFGIQSCTARVTTSGYITMTGGKSVQEIVYWLSIFIHKLLYYLSYYAPFNTFRITEYTVHNKVCKCRIPYKINLNGLGDFLKLTNLSFKTTCSKNKQETNITSTTKINYNPDKICLIYIQMLNINGRKVTFSIGPDGGIIVLAYLHSYEILLLSYGLSYLLKDFLVTRTLNDKIKQQVKCKTYKRKIKNNQKWKNLTDEKDLPPPPPPPYD